MKKTAIAGGQKNRRGNEKKKLREDSDSRSFAEHFHLKVKMFASGPRHGNFPGDEFVAVKFGEEFAFAVVAELLAFGSIASSSARISAAGVSAEKPFPPQSSSLRRSAARSGASPGDPAVGEVIFVAGE